MVSSNLLKTIRFSKTKQWNVKYFFSTSITSKYPISNIGKHTIHITSKTKLFEEPEKEFRILGISNEVGMFDAYMELGKNINQPYIYVENGCLAYNPYRVNVGSIGLKTDELLNEYISPAYVVFKCKETLLPEYLYLVLKTSIFNTLIKDNTTGSVRQTLSYDKLSNINIPVPPVDIQCKLVEKYNDYIKKAQSIEQKADLLNEEMDNYIFDMLKIEKRIINKNDLKLLKTTSFSKMVGWGAKMNSNTIKPQDVFKSSQFDNLPLEFFCELNPKTIYPEDVEDVSFIPMECVSDIYGEIIEHKVGKTNKSKGYTAFQENDVIWAKITPCMQNGKCAVATNLKNGCAYGSTEFHVFRTNENALPEYIYCLLRTKRLRKVAMSYFTGSAGQQRVGTDFLEMLTFPKLPIYSDNPNVITQEAVVRKVFDIRNQVRKMRTQAKKLRTQAKKEFEEAVFNEA